MYVKGYSVSGPAASLMNSLAGRTALVCGNAETVFDDFHEAKRRSDNPVIFAVNDVGMYLPTVDHWVSLHGDKLKAFAAVRGIDASLGQGFLLHTNWKTYGLETTWELEPAFSLSGYFAAQVAYLMGCETIIFCGCPGDGTRRFFDAAPRTDFAYGAGDSSGDKAAREQLVKEMARVSEMKATIRSMSGWSRDFFGSIS